MNDLPLLIASPRRLHRRRIALVLGLAADDVAIYEVHNSGHWYDFGFLLGASVAFSGAARTGRPTPRESRKRT